MQPLPPLRPVRIAILLSATVLAVATAPSASAHERFTVSGKYHLGIGWLKEPPIVDDPNAITVEVGVDNNGATDDPGTGLAGAFTLTLGHAGKVLDLDFEESDETPGLYIASFIPTQAGVYSAEVQGSLGGKAFDIQAQPEPVETATAHSFPDPITSKADLQANATTVQVQQSKSTQDVAALQKRMSDLEDRSILLAAAAGVAAAMAVLGIVLAGVAAAKADRRVPTPAPSSRPPGTGPQRPQPPK